jgi:hypothetical protein
MSQHVYHEFRDSDEKGTDLRNCSKERKILVDYIRRSFYWQKNEQELKGIIKRLKKYIERKELILSSEKYHYF